MADRCWFTLDPQAQPVGPYSPAELTGYAGSGLLHESQVFWKEGNAGWQKLADIPELDAAHKALQAHIQQHGQQQQQANAPSAARAHPHTSVIRARPSDPLEAFKHEIEAVEKAGPAAEDDAAAEAADAANGDEEDAREGTPEELEFEDDDGTIYKWDHTVRKYVPAAETDAAAAAAAGGGGGGGNGGAATQAQQQQDAGYDIEAMTFVAEEEIIPTLAAARAAEEAAGGAGSKKRAGDADEQQQGKKPKPSGVGQQGPAAAAGAAAAAAGGDADSKSQQQQQQQQPPGWFELKKNTSVYVTGLPQDTDADEVAGVFAKCGIIKLDDSGQPRIKLYRDKETGLLKGDGLVTYLKEPSVLLACQILDGTPLRSTGPTMSVTEAKFEMKGQQYQDKKGAQGKASNSKGSGKGGGRGGGRGGKGGGRGGGRKKGNFGVQEKLERKLGWGGFDDVLPPEKVTVVLKHLFTPDEAEAGAASFAADLEADVLSECSKLGQVEKVRVFAQHPEGVVTVRFKQEEPAQGCISLMHGRFFGGHRLMAHMWDGFTHYHGVKTDRKETAEEEAARLEAFARELEQKQQQEADAAGSGNGKPAD